MMFQNFVLNQPEHGQRDEAGQKMGVDVFGRPHKNGATFQIGFHNVQRILMLSDEPAPTRHKWVR